MLSKNEPINVDPLFWLYGKNYRTFNREVAKILDSINAAIFLSELADKYKLNLDEKTLTDDGFFYYEQKDVEQRILLKRKCQDSSIDILINCGLIQKKNRGMPQKRYFKINIEEALKLFFKLKGSSCNSKDPLFWLYADNYCPYNADVAKTLESVYAAIFLAELSSSFRYFRERKELTDDGFFFYEIDDMEKKTHLSLDQQNTCVSILLKKNLIQKEVKGCSPPRRYFKINEECILMLFFNSNFYEKQEKYAPQDVSAILSESYKSFCPRVEKHYS